MTACSARPHERRTSRSAARPTWALVVAACCTAGAVAAGRGAATQLDAAQDHFYSGRFTEAAEAARQADADAVNLEAAEVRTSAILFQIKRQLADARDKKAALAACASCDALIAAFNESFKAGQAAAREQLRADPRNPDTLFYLGKIDLNYLWLVLDPLGRRTGWNEYWEARRSLDTALSMRPDFQRARVARAWIDYIVDTRTPWGSGWILGGGNRKKALAAMRSAAEMNDDPYAKEIGRAHV